MKWKVSYFNVVMNRVMEGMIIEYVFADEINEKWHLCKVNITNLCYFKETNFELSIGYSAEIIFVLSLTMSILSCK